MSDTPLHIVQRRARLRAQRRRRRIAAAVALLLCAGGIAVAANQGTGSPPIRRAAHPRSKPSRVAPAPVHSRGAAPDRELARLLRAGQPIYCGGNSGHEVALTFDDGPGVYTHLALKKLAQAHERVTFFVVGRSINAYPGYLQREARIAEIGDHTYTHPELTALPAPAITHELAATAALINSQIHRPVHLFRPPYELHNALVDGIARRLGMLTILWSIDSRDSLGANYAQIAANVAAGLRPGSIVELHENHGQTIRAMSAMLGLLHRRGLRSVGVLQLLVSDPPSARQLREGPFGCAGAPVGTARHSE